LSPLTASDARTVHLDIPRAASLAHSHTSPGAREKKRKLVGELFETGEAHRGAAARIDILGRLRPVLRFECLGEPGRSYDAEKKGKRAVDAQEQGVVGFADHAANFDDRNGGDFIDRDLGSLTQSVSLGRMDFKSDLIGVVAQHGRERANHNRRQFGEKIALHDKRGTGLAVVSRRHHDHELTAPHYGSGHW